MHEILFKGFHPDENGKEKVYVNGEWIKGFWVDGDLIRSERGIPHITVCGEFCKEVITETVCQYTGLKDKNGNLIFDGDIAKFKRFENSYVGKIVFNQNTAGFEFWWNVIVGAYGEKATRQANLSVCDEIKIIGNVHSNPELLEV